MKNEYEIRGEDTAIFLYGSGGIRMETIISTSSLEIVNEFKNTWRLMYDKNIDTFYAYGSQHFTKGKNSRFGLHRWIAGMPPGMEIDHMNHDTLDNRISNLRVLTKSENAQNRKGATRKSSSGIRGVHWHKRYGKWEVQIKVSGKKITIGYFDDIGEAEKSAIESRRKYMPFSNEDAV